MLDNAIDLFLLRCKLINKSGWCRRHLLTFHHFFSGQMHQGVWRQSDFSDALFVGSQLFIQNSDTAICPVLAFRCFHVWRGDSDGQSIRCRLTNAWMYDVDLRYADLTGADLTSARLYAKPICRPADITGVTWTMQSGMERMHLRLTPVLITSEPSRENEPWTAYPRSCPPCPFVAGRVELQCQQKIRIVMMMNGQITTKNHVEPTR